MTQVLEREQTPTHSTVFTASTITAKGQTTVPLSMRTALNAMPGAKLVWSAMPGGAVSVRIKTDSLFNLAGIVKAPKGKKTPLPVGQMNAWAQ